ncbi:hypothetical Protein YC6258_03233 [Gynuella sunshinyii YC6258]|uniref:Uncharacterized protein n=1 Tax=Gynuella sunshinyii YC6258 TaxID=1445510 RepID=A0A0C5VY33_9GAMM|nr:hypothetical Protein YC6258_03233 [Gynuella sunshinyii YC6258]
MTSRVMGLKIWQLVLTVACPAYNRSFYTFGFKQSDRLCSRI